jgi:predicted transcriptional regulator
MPNLSIKLDEATRARLQEQAARQGITPHALMVKAIALELDRSETQDAFVARALEARARVEAGGPVLDGRAFAAYLRARVRGEAVPRPAEVTLAGTPITHG